jgi:DNA-binding response OmpR family regulator
MPDTVLIVEDEPALRDTLVYNLKKDGFAVEAVGDGRSALEAARRLKPDLIVLDIMLPELDGFEVARILRKEMITPILMLTARDDEIDRVVGLEVGADDYLTKPFSMRELMARVKAQLRRARFMREELDQSIEVSKQQTLQFGDLVINLTRREVTLTEEPLALKPQEYELLVFFADTKGTCSHASLSWNVYGVGISSATAGPWMCMYGGCVKRSRLILQNRPGSLLCAAGDIALKVRTKH